jgi:hypothetical protein
MNGRVLGRVGRKSHIFPVSFPGGRCQPATPWSAGAPRDAQALQGTGELADIGSVVAFLASNDACWITGDTIRVDDDSKLWASLLRQRPTGECHGWTAGSYSVRPF